MSAQVCFGCTDRQIQNTPLKTASDLFMEKKNS